MLTGHLYKRRLDAHTRRQKSEEEAIKSLYTQTEASVCATQERFRIEEQATEMGMYNMGLHQGMIGYEAESAFERG